MKITAQHDDQKPVYWLAEFRVKGRLMLCEGQSYKEALHGAITLLIEQSEAKARQRFHPYPSTPKPSTPKQYQPSPCPSGAFFMSGDTA
ncbi:hypothetical protein [Oceanospirillum maris]|jgi:hypothetical protein|uniref:hypothetical protein n=1 Tax=Oceanospirillum maris TaxID=64977 RepID=UPI00040C28B6|nr:hypothetical protein [Oceanospirillum maris]